MQPAELLTNHLQNRELLSDEHKALIDGIERSLPPALLAWPIEQLVRVGDARDNSWMADTEEMARLLCRCTTPGELMRVWVSEYRRRMKYPKISGIALDSVLETRALNISTPEGFCAMAKQFMKAPESHRGVPRAAAPRTLEVYQ